MPNVGGVQYPYTPEGIAAAQQAQSGLDPARMSPPLTSPSHPMAQRPYQQPQQVQMQQSPGAGYMLSASSPYRQQGDDTQYDVYGNIIPRQQSRDLQPYHIANPQHAQQQYLSTLASNYAGSPSGPVGQAYRPVAQAPRGRTIESSGPANYGSSPSNPNWGQGRGGRSIGKMGPTFAPTSLNYNAISPANRIAGNIAAVMSGRPSPGTNPHINPYGPTGQLRPPRQPIQKRG